MHDDCDALLYFSHVCDKLVGKSADGAILKVQWQKILLYYCELLLLFTL